MKFGLCIALNSLVKEEGARVGCRYDAVSVKFSMFSLGHWSAEVEFPEFMFSYEVDAFVAWALTYCCSYIIFPRKGCLVLAVQ